jgi:hypothetical protein
MRDQGKTAVDEAPAGGVNVPFGGARAAADVLLRPGQPLFYRVPEVMRMLAMSRSVLFEQLRNGRLGSVRQGRARKIPVAAILDYIDLLEREAEAAR